MKELTGRVAVVTGGSGGIGTAILRALGNAGATAVSLDVAAAAEFPWIECDIREDLSVAGAMTQVIDRYERVDIAVHAAGISRDAVVWKLAPEQWDDVMAVNLRGAYLLVHHVVPAMRMNGGGRIVLIGSINGSRGKFGLSAYAASKAGLIGLTKSVCRETGRFGITANVVEPGWVRTPLTDKLPESIRQSALDETLLGELVEPQDVAAAVTYLAGPGGKRVTGQVLRVDAGQYL